MTKIPENETMMQFQKCLEGEFLNLDKESIISVMQELKTIGGIKLWIWFYLVKDKRNLSMPTEQIMKECGIDKFEYSVGIEELKEKGYLIQTEVRYKFMEDKINSACGCDFKECLVFDSKKDLTGICTGRQRLI